MTKRSRSTVDAAPETSDAAQCKRTKSEVGLLFPDESATKEPCLSEAADETADKALLLDGSVDLPFSQVRQIYQGRWTNLSISHAIPKTPAMCALLHNSKVSLTKLELKHNFRPVGEQLPFIMDWAPNIIELECSSMAGIAALAKIPVDRLPSTIRRVIFRSGKSADVTKLLKNLSGLTHVCVVEVCDTDPKRRATLCRVLSKLPLKTLDIDDTIYRCGSLFGGSGSRISDTLEEFRFCNIALNEPLPLPGKEGGGGWEIPLLPGSIDRCTNLIRLTLGITSEYKQEYIDTIAKMGTVKSIALDVCDKDDVTRILSIPSLRELIIPKCSAAPKFLKTVTKAIMQSGMDIGPRSADPDERPWASSFIVTPLFTATPAASVDEVDAASLASSTLFVSIHK
jgi:hypothetical protein